MTPHSHAQRHVFEKYVHARARECSRSIEIFRIHSLDARDGATMARRWRATRERASE